MKKLLLTIFSFALLFSASAAHAQQADNACDFSGSGADYTCYSNESKPDSCALVGGSLGGGFTCAKVPTGFTLTGFNVKVTANPTSGIAGQINPTISWSAPSAASDPTVCSGAGIAPNGPSTGSVSVGTITSAGTQTYTVTCTNSGGSAKGFANVTATAAASQTTSQNTGNCGAVGNQLGYCPLEPLPGLENVQNLDFPTFLGAVFKLLITAGALLAVGTLVYAGIMYIVSGAGVELANAKMRMRAALMGMLILLGAWLMLNTINPTLLNFNLSSIGAGNTSMPTGNTTQGASTQTTSSINNLNSAIYGVNNIPNASQLQSGIVDCGGKVPVLSPDNEVVCP